MVTVRIEHTVPDFGAWKQVFDSDPVGREKVGVRHYEVLRAIDEPNHVMIDLGFDTRDEADAFIATMQGIWSRVQGVLVMDPTARIAETVEMRRY